ncbi:MAG: hypothetical protein RL227_556, partial [Pseudomonadota bacterium]
MHLNNIRLGKRLGLGFGTVIALLLVVATLSAQRLQSAQADSTRVQELQRRATLAETWRGDANLNVSGTIAIARSGGLREVDEFFAPQIKATSERITDFQKELTELVDSDKGKTLVTAIAERRAAYVDARKEVLALISAGNGAAAKALLGTKLMPAADQYTAAIAALAEYQEGRAQDASAAMTAQLLSAKLLLLGVVAVAAMVAIGYAVAITRSVTRPLASAAAAAERMAAGDMSAPVVVEGSDEVADVQQALSRMQQALSGLVGEVRASSESIATASAQIATGNHDLSTRTEQTASNLQQAASSLEELTGTVGQTADSARTAN